MTDQPEPSDDKTDKIHTLLALAMNEVKAVGKDGQYSGGAAGSFRFRGIDAVMNAVGPAFRKWGIVGPVPRLDRITQDRVTTGKDKRETNRTTVQVTFYFYGPTGDYVYCTVPGEGFDFGDKATSKAMSVACRTALLQTLCLPTDEPDPDQEVYEQNGSGSAVVQARQLLVDKMKRLRLDPEDVIRLYAADHDGRDPRTDEDPDRILAFTDRLAPQPA